MSQAGASVSARPPATQTHAKHPSISSTTTSIASAAPPSKAEIERKLSVKLSSVNPPARKPTRKPSLVTSGNESDASHTSPSNASSALPPLITSSLGFGGGQFSTSPVGTTPTTPGPLTHGPLSAIAERRTTPEMNNGTPPPPLEIESAVLDEDESDEDEGVNAELERGMDGERIFKSGFLIKKQERRKVWKKKWFVLRATKIAYYKDNREYSLSRAIDLRQVHSVVPVASEKQKHPFAFAIVTSDRNFMVEAMSADERDEWVRAINSVRKRVAERDVEEAARRHQAQQVLSKPIPMPVPAAPGGHHLEAEPHHGTWTSTFSNTTGLSASPAASTSGGYFRGASSGPTGPSSWHPPTMPHAQGPPQSPSANAKSQMANANLGRSASTASNAGAPPPSAASINRRLSNPIPVPSIQPKATLHRNPSMEQAGGMWAGLSPPNATPQFVSSDEDEPYFSDPNAAWPENVQPAIVHPSTPDPNQVILGMYLMKKSRKTTRQVWRKRWFFLTAAGITYTKSHMDPRPLTFIPIQSILDVFSVDPEDDDEDAESSGPERSRSPPSRHLSNRSRRDGAVVPKAQQHVVRIVCTKRRYDLCAPSEEEEIKWTAAIRALLNRERERQGGNGTCATEASSTHPQPITIPTIAQVPPTPGLSNIPSPVTSVATDSPTSATSPRRAAAR